jgi:WD40 repeat protein
VGGGRDRQGKRLEVDAQRQRSRLVTYYGGMDTGYVALWDAKTGATRKVFRNAHHAAWSPDGALMAVPTDPGGLVLLDGHTGAPKKVLRADPPSNAINNTVVTPAFSPDGATLAVAYPGRLETLGSTPPSRGWRSSSRRAAPRSRGLRDAAGSATLSHGPRRTSGPGEVRHGRSRDRRAPDSR